ncbi:chitinase [Thermoflavifilum thermophilum]|uniref:Chitinase class I n=1 Tax=Thermoflavifilum thermophilum TaxID=1393122 RepID=A0A1I7N797_9BACT|nr:chitinase [Thermoflavifilum thermophilum]SFV30517.1 Chitinase class I [Thermoflavifilum thermophilum]
MGRHVLLWICIGTIIGLPAHLRAQSPPLDEKPDSATFLTHILSARKWDQLFPNRYGKAHLGPNAADSGKSDFYTFQAFVAAARKFPGFLGEGSPAVRRRELSAFLAHVAQETSGGWDQAPGGYLKWGLYFRQERGCAHGCPQYSVANVSYPPVPGVSYHGRGPLQLSYNYLYGMFSEAWFGSKDSLLEHPEKLLQDSVLAFASAIWFWMTPIANKPSCHAVITGQWLPAAADSAAGRLPGFGVTLNIINGGEECGHPPSAETLHRYDFYEYFCQQFHVDPGLNLMCTYQQPFSLHP